MVKKNVVFFGLKICVGTVEDCRGHRFVEKVVATPASQGDIPKIFIDLQLGYIFKKLSLSYFFAADTSFFTRYCPARASAEVSKN